MSQSYVVVANTQQPPSRTYFGGQAPASPGLRQGPLVDVVTTQVSPEMQIFGPQGVNPSSGGGGGGPTSMVMTSNGGGPASMIPQCVSHPGASAAPHIQVVPTHLAMPLGSCRGTGQHVLSLSP